MGITVRETLRVGGLQSGQLPSGEQGLNNVIDSVCVLEQPMYRYWLRPNEFMLTTFYEVRAEGRWRSRADHIY